MDTEEKKRYDIVISIHHFGYFDSAVAVGAFIEFIDTSPDGTNKIEQTIPLNIKPYTLSLEKGINDKTSKTLANLKEYLFDIVKVGLSIIINEIN